MLLKQILEQLEKESKKLHAVFTELQVQSSQLSERTSQLA